MRYRFARFTFDAAARRLHRGREILPLTDKPLTLLAALVERRGAVVPREELCRRLWGDDTFVDFDNNLNATVRRLREALGDGSLVETLPRLGYRLAVPVRPVARRAPALTAAAAALALAGLGLALRPEPTRTPAATRPLLAVVPFTDLRPDPPDPRFADGLTDELITQLGRLAPRQLGVISQLSAFAFRDRGLGAGEVGRELGAAYLLEGSLLDGADGQVITARLVRVADQGQLWAARYAAGDAGWRSSRSDIVRRIATSLALELLPGRPEALARATTTSPEAFEAYGRGRYELTRRDPGAAERAARHFERAIATDPAYALAHAALAETWNRVAFGDAERRAAAFEHARAAAERAISLAPDLPEGHNALAFARLYGEWDLEAAERSFQRAVDLNPGASKAQERFAGLLAATGRLETALRAAQCADYHDPIETLGSADVGWYYLFNDRPREALEACASSLSADSANAAARACADQARRMLAPEAGVPRVVTAGSETQPGSPVERAAAAALAGDDARALAWLEVAYERREPWLVYLGADPRFDRLRGGAAFERLVEAIGAPVPEDGPSRPAPGG